MLKGKLPSAHIMLQTHMQRSPQCHGSDLTLHCHRSVLKELTSNSRNYWQNHFQKLINTLPSWINFNFSNTQLKIPLVSFKHVLQYTKALKRDLKEQRGKCKRIPRSFKVISVQSQLQTLTSFCYQLPNQK